MSGLLQVCLFSVFAEGCWAGTREKQGLTGAVSRPCAFIPKQDERVVEVKKDGSLGFLPVCVTWWGVLYVPEVIMVMIGET